MFGIDNNLWVTFLARWIHFMVGITWIGMLYFFNLVNVHFAKLLDAETKKKVVPELMPRALFWFRWGAMLTLLSGLFILYWNYWVASSGGFSALFAGSYGFWITFGGVLGIIMWFIVWFIIWPAQKKIIRWVKNGEAPAEMAGLAKRAAHVSKVNTYLSVPMLFGMGAASHFPVDKHWMAVVVLAVGFLIVYVTLKASAKVLPKL
ncbi:MAG: urate hydroxylase PuuD [bacterium]|nr:urate hydroxylase PuuD [bacterium]